VAADFILLVTTGQMSHQMERIASTLCLNNENAMTCVRAIPTTVRRKKSRPPVFNSAGNAP